MQSREPLRIGRAALAIAALAIMGTLTACGSAQPTTVKAREVPTLESDDMEASLAAFSCDGIMPTSRDGGWSLACDEHRVTKYALGPAILTESHIKSASAGTPAGMLSWAIDVSLNEPGAQILADTTAKHIGDQIAIVVDHVVLSAPVIASAIDVGELGITGDFTEASAKKLAKEIKQTSMSVRQVLATRPAG